MSLRVTRRASIQLLLGAMLSPSGFAQQTAPPAQAPPLQRRPAAPPGTPQRPVVLDVVVTDKSGNPVPGLTQQDFTLLDDKRPQPIVSFRAMEESGDVPVQAILVIDAINTSFQGVAIQRAGLDKFLRSGSGELPLPTSVILLTDKTAVQSAITKNRIDLATGLNSQEATLRTINRSQGYYGAVERLQLSMKAFEQVVTVLQSREGRKLLLWIGPGWPLLSGPDVQMSNRDREGLFSTAVALSAELREARITLYCIDPSGPTGSMSGEFYFQDFVKGVPAANRMQQGNLAVQVLAVQSGGKVINMSNDLPDSITRCIADAKAYYALTFDAPEADRPAEYHSLEVKIAKHGLTARTRTGYYAQP